MYTIRVRVNNLEVQACKYIKYLGLLIDEDWSFVDHIRYIEKKVSKVTRALYGLLPYLRGPREKKRRLYAAMMNSIIMYGSPIWADSTHRKKINDGLRRIQRVIAIRVIAGYRTISADAALLLARMAPAHLQAAYYKRVFLRIHELKRRGEQ